MSYHFFKQTKLEKTMTHRVWPVTLNTRGKFLWNHSLKMPHKNNYDSWIKTKCNYRKPRLNTFEKISYTDIFELIHYWIIVSNRVGIIPRT